MKKRVRVYCTRIQKLFRLKFELDRNYLVGKFVIKLPSEHLLPEHQSENRLYDRFLPFLVQVLPKDSFVIDVGANVGDTLASMVAVNSDCSYVCIEPDAKFYSFLEKNRSTILASFPFTRIQLFQEVISSYADKLSLDGTNGTRAAYVDNIHGKKTVTLDSVVEQNSFGPVSLLKVDVDGRDWDVLFSSRKLISESQPIIYFEMYIQTDSNLKRYEQALMMLRESGYETFYLFDSFGALMLQTTEISHILAVGSYLLLQDNKRSTRTTFYLDVLCGVREQSIILRESVSHFLDWAG